MVSGSYYVTLSGGVGNDTIYNSGYSSSISGGAGNDLINGHRGYYATISGGNGNDTIDTGYYGNNSSISGDAGNDSIYSRGSYSTIDGGAGSDTITNSYDGYNSFVNGGAGHDSIYSNGRYSTVNGGSGNDSIENRGVDSSISGGEGDDYIYSQSSYNGTVYSSSYYVTLNGGKGDDIINLTSGNHILKYAKGDGDDIVLGFNSTDTLHITKGSYSVKTEANDVIVTVGDGKIILKGAAGQKLTIKNSKGKVTKKTYGSSGLFAEDNFVENELESIIENKSPAAIEDFRNTDMTNLVAKISLTSGVDGGEN